MSPATPLPEAALAPHIELVRLHAEAALVRRFNAGYGFADSHIPAEVYLRDPGARERLGRDSLRPQDTHLAQAHELEQAIARSRAALQSHVSPLTILSERFELAAAEAELLAIAVAYELDRDVRDLCHALAGRRRPLLYGDVCQELAPALASAAVMLRVLHPAGVLRQSCLIELEAGDATRSKLACAVEVDRRVLDWLLGDPRLAEPLDAIMHVRDPAEDLHVHLDPAVLAQLERVAETLQRSMRARSALPLVLIQGAPGAGKQAAAHRLAALLGRPLAVAPLPAVLTAAERSREPRLLDQVLGEARLRGAIAYLPGIDTLAAAPGPDASAAAAGELALTALERHGDVAVLATREQGMPSLPLRRPFALVHIPAATLSVRVQAWAHGLAALADVASPELRTGASGERSGNLAGERSGNLAGERSGNLAGERSGDLADQLATSYVIGPGAVGEVVHEARAFARATGAPVGRAELEQAVGRRLTLRLGQFATRIARRARLDDMVLPDDVREIIEDMIAMVRQRAQILERWGYARHLGLSRGVSALFSGDPGTGKTMAASVIASALGLDLFRIDLSAVTSKWVGETEKHLARIFDEAQSAHAMLLFDEADSLFGKRTELKSAQDRYANLEVNYVLQRMESFDGVSVLTTNLESAIDPAFLRRLNFRIRFPAPEAEERAELWRRLLPPETGLVGRVDVRALADRFVMTGGHIRNAIVRAAVVAARDGRPMAEHDLLAGAHHEYIELGKVMPALIK